MSTVNVDTLWDVPKVGSTWMSHDGRTHMHVDMCIYIYTVYIYIHIYIYVYICSHMSITCTIV